MINDSFSIKLQTTTDQVRSQLGEPKKQTFENEQIILWYGSHAPSRADLYYFQNGLLEKYSLYVAKNNHSVEQAIKEWGLPDLSYRKYASEDDSPLEVVYVWPQKGIQIFAIGQDQQSLIERLEQFSPRSVQEYQQTIGSKYVGNEPVTLTPENTTISMEDVNSILDRIIPDNFIYPLVGLIFFMIFCVIVVTRLRSQKSKHTQQSSDK
jgi:hypothetical protein